MSAKGSGFSAEEKRERKNAAERARYAANIERERERGRLRQKVWRAANPDGYDREARRERYAAEAEQAREYSRLYRTEHADDEAYRCRRQAGNAAYYAANRDRLAADNRRRGAADHERRDARSKAWRLANPGRQAELAKAWGLANPERALAISRKNASNRRARKADAFVEAVDPIVVYERDGGICQICGEPIGDAKWHIDHCIPLARGGEHSYANTQLAHAICNLKKGPKLG